MRQPANPTSIMPKAITLVAPARSAVFAILLLAPAVVASQDRLKSMPGYERFQRMSPLIRSAVGGNPLSAGGVSWSADEQSVEYVDASKRYRFDVGTKKSTKLGVATDMRNGGRGGRGGGGQPARGR